MKDDPKIEFESRINLIDYLLAEIVNRKKIMKKKRIVDFERYVSLNTWNDVKLGYQYLIVDDIWDIISSKPAKLALNFMMILLYYIYMWRRIVRTHHHNHIGLEFKHH
jgi:hypothetical protein